MFIAVMRTATSLNIKTYLDFCTRRTAGNIPAYLQSNDPAVMALLSDYDFYRMEDNGKFTPVKIEKDGAVH